jgi:hypothetical protein
LDDCPFLTHLKNGIVNYSICILTAMMSAWLFSWLLISYYVQIEEEEELPRVEPVYQTPYVGTGHMYDGSDYAQNIGT